jgi:phospholipid/cholesterol/gamma-HCH transport system substrate-binding protein
METKANTALIGAFTLVVLALGFVFIYWLARGSEQGNNVPLVVVFQDPVTGLSVGSQVVFNGIKIGDVKTLDLDPKQPSNVVATLNVQPLRSIKQDTQVTLGFQGLTGVGYVEMAGGSPEKPPIWETMPRPMIVATRSSMQDLLAGARNILARTDSALKSIETIVTENTDDVTQSVQDVRRFTGALAANSDKVADLIDQVSSASTAIADAANRLQGIVDRAETVMAAVDPEQVRSTIADVSTTLKNLAAQSERLDTIMQRADAVSADISSFSERLPALGERADALLAAIDPQKVGDTLTRIDAIAAAVDPAQVQGTVEGLSTLAQTLSDNRENIDRIITTATSLSNDLSAFAARLPVMGDKADALLAAVDPTKVSRTLDNAERFSTTLAENREDIDQIIADTRALSARFQGIGERADSLLAKLDSMAGEGTGGILEDAKETLAAVRDAANAFNVQVTTVGGGLNSFSDRGLRDLTNLLSQGQRTISRLDRVISDLEQNPSGLLFGGPDVPEYSGRRR